MTTNVDDANAMFGIIAWILSGVTIMGFGIFFTWNPRWWSYLRGALTLPNQDITVVLLLVFGGFEGWGIWQHWARTNMNHDIWLPVFWWVFLSCESFYFPTLMLSPMWFIPAAFGLLGTVFACLYFCFAFFKFSHTLAGIMGIVAAVVGVIQCIVACVMGGTANLYEKYEEVKEQIVPVESKHDFFSNMFKKHKATAKSTEDPEINAVPTGSRVGKSITTNPNSVLSIYVGTGVPTQHPL